MEQMRGSVTCLGFDQSPRRQRYILSGHTLGDGARNNRGRSCCASRTQVLVIDVHICLRLQVFTWEWTIFSFFLILLPHFSRFCPAAECLNPRTFVPSYPRTFGRHGPSEYCCFRGQGNIPPSPPGLLNRASSSFSPPRSLANRNKR